jgi:hypothetical protein
MFEILKAEHLTTAEDLLHHFGHTLPVAYQNFMLKYDG